LFLHQYEYKNKKHHAAMHLKAFAVVLDFYVQELKNYFILDIIRQSAN